MAALNFVTLPPPPTPLPNSLPMPSGPPPLFDTAAAGRFDAINIVCSAFKIIDSAWKPFGTSGISGSRLFLDYYARSLSPIDIRSYLACCIEVMVVYGIPPEVYWPFVLANNGVAPPLSVVSRAKNHTLLTYANFVNDPDQLKVALINGYLLILGVSVLSGWSSDVSVTGSVSPQGVVTAGTGIVSQHVNDTIVGHTTLLIVNYDEANQWWVAQTSLGVDSGASGYYFFPYEYICDPGWHLATDIWAMTSVSSGPKIDCVLGQWVDGPCSSQVCGGPPGTLVSTPTILTNPSNAGLACPPPVTKMCTAVCPPPVDCVVGSWTAGLCTPVKAAGSLVVPTCGYTGTRTDVRSTVTSAANGGIPCPSLSQTDPCAGPPCAVDCVVGGWSTYGVCDASLCGAKGNQVSTRQVTTPSANGGLVCPVLSQTQPCSAAACPVTTTPVGCTVTDWSDWSPCSATACLTKGVRTSTRDVTQAASNGGQACPDLQMTTPCHAPCPVGRWVTISAAILFVVIVIVVVIVMAIASSR